MFIQYYLSMGLSAEGEASCGLGQCGGGSSRGPSSRRRRHMLSLLIPRCRFPSCALCSSGVVILHQLSRDAGAPIAPLRLCLLIFFFFSHRVLFSEIDNNFPKAGDDRGLKLSFRDRFAYDIAHCFSCVFRQKVLHSKIWEKSWCDSSVCSDKWSPPLDCCL